MLTFKHIRVFAGHSGASFFSLGTRTSPGHKLIQSGSLEVAKMEQPSARWLNTSNNNPAPVLPVDALSRAHR